MIIVYSLHLVVAVLEAGFRAHLYPNWLLPLFPYTHYPLYRTSLACSVFLVVSVALERHAAVCSPHRYREHSQARHRAALCYILPR